MPFNVEGGLNAEGTIAPPNKGTIRPMIKQMIKPIIKPIIKKEED